MGTKPTREEKIEYMKWVSEKEENVDPLDYLGQIGFLGQFAIIVSTFCIGYLLFQGV